MVDIHCRGSVLADMAEYLQLYEETRNHEWLTLALYAKDTARMLKERLDTNPEYYQKQGKRIKNFTGTLCTI